MFCNLIFCVLTNELNTLTISRRGATAINLEDTEKSALSVQNDGFLVFTRQAMEIPFRVDNNCPERNLKSWKFLIAEQEKCYRNC